LRDVHVDFTDHEWRGKRRGWWKEHIRIQRMIHVVVDIHTNPYGPLVGLLLLVAVALGGLHLPGKMTRERGDEGSERNEAVRKTNRQHKHPAYTMDDRCGEKKRGGKKKKENLKLRSETKPNAMIMGI
jgi:hypothetical protein